jgi:NAD(P)-dependent dehydrogenase (short-subunit alcohol dehydrogenase family)
MNDGSLRAPGTLSNPVAQRARWRGCLNPPLREWAGRRVWVVGASSGIGRALAHALHEHGAQVTVSARDENALDAFRRDHPGSHAMPLDVTDLASVQRAAALVQGAPLDLVVYCAGHYRPMGASTWSLEEMIRHQQVNYVGALHVLDAVLPSLLERGAGHVSLVGSVAGYRGLPKSLAYGPTKAALISLAETLFLDGHARGLGVSIINPGFVETPLTAQNDFHMPALMSTDAAARAILRGWARGAFEIHFPKRFTLVMKALRLLPFPLYQAVVRRVTGA